jgi:hypothetical protein
MTHSLLQLTPRLVAISHQPPTILTSVSRSCNESESESESYVTTDGQSASLSWYKAPIQGLRPYSFSVRNTEYVWQLRFWFHGEPSLTRGRVCLLYVPLGFASAVFLGPSPLGLVTIFYCFRFKISLFVASYNSQGHGGGIQPGLHTGSSLISRADQSSSLLPASSQYGHSWHRAPLGPMAIYLFNVKTSVFFSLLRCSSFNKKGGNPLMGWYERCINRFVS